MNVSRILFIPRTGWTAICLVPESLPESCCYLENRARARLTAEAVSQFCIAPAGVYRAIRLAADPVSFYLAFSPVSAQAWADSLFSVALSSHH